MNSSEDMNTVTAAPESEPTLEEKLTAVQENWTGRVKELNEMLKDLPGIDRMLNNVYSVHQDAVEYYHLVLRTLGKLTRLYRINYATMYNQYKTVSQIRYTSDVQINNQIEAQLNDLRERISLMEDQVKFMDSTIDNIRSIEYAVKNKIEIYRLINKIGI